MLFMNMLSPVLEFKLYFRVNPAKYDFLTPLHDKYRADWPEFKLTKRNKNKIPECIPVIKDAIDNIDSIYKTLLGL